MLKQLVVPIGALLAGTCFLLLGVGLLNTLLPIRGEEVGYSEQTLGFITSCYFIGFLFGTYLGPRLIRRIGHIRAFAFCAAVIACSILLCGLFEQPQAWMFIRIVTGTALVTLYTTIESWLNGQTAREQRGQVFAIYMVVNLVALALSQQMLRLETETTFTLFALCAIFVSVALMPIMLTRMTPPTLPTTPGVKIKQLYRAAPIALYGAMLSGLAMGAFWGLTAIFLSQLGQDKTSIASVMSAAIIGGAVLQWPMGRYSDSHDRRRVLIMVAIGATGSATLLALIGMSEPESLLPLLVAAALYGGFAFAVYPLTVAHLIDHLTQENILEGSSGLLLVHGLGAVVGPAAAGIFMQYLGAVALPMFFLSTHGLLILVIMWHLKRAPAPVTSDEQHAHYVPMLRTTPEVLNLHPDQTETQPE